MLILFLGIAVITDIRSGKIPNWLIVTGLFAGIWIADHKIQSILLGIFIILLFFPLFHIGAVGAGDSKCFAVLCFYLTWGQVVWSIVYTFILAAVWIVITMLYHHSFLKTNQKIHLAPFILGGVLISVGGTYL